jgi:uncharacterized coiled-coil DUF342 family protein
MTDSEFKYWAFLSFSLQDNGAQRSGAPADGFQCWANWLHDELKSFSVPAEFIGQINARGEIIPERIDPIFQDELEQPDDASLSAEVRAALEQSRCLIVICSPRSAQSLHVNEAVRYFKQLGRGGQILPLVIAGEPNAGMSQRPDQSPADECFVPALRHPLHADGTVDTTRPAGKRLIADARHGSEQREILAQDNPGTEADLETAKLQVIAELIGVWFGGLWSREQDRRFIGFAEARQQTRKALDQVAFAQRQIRETESKVLETQNLPSDVHSQIQEAQTKAIAAQEQAREAQSQLQDLQHKTRETQSQLEETRQRLLAAESKFLEAQNQVQAARRQAEEVEQQLVEARSQVHVQGTPAEIQAARHQTEAAQRQIEELQNQAQQSLNQVQEARSQAEAAQNEVREAHHQAEEARRQLEETRSQVQVVTGQLQEQQQQTEAARRQVQEFQSQAQQALTQLQEARSQAEAAHDQARESHRQTGEAERYLQESRSQVEAVTGQLQEQQHQAETAKRQAQEIQSQAREAQTQVEEIKNKAQRVRRLTKVLAVIAVLGLLAAGLAAERAWREHQAAREALATLAAQGVWEPDFTRGKMDSEQIGQALNAIVGAEPEANRQFSLDRLAAWVPRAEIPETLKAASIIVDDSRRRRFQQQLLIRLSWANPLSAMTCAGGMEGKIANASDTNDVSIYFQLALLDNWMRSDLPAAFNWVCLLPDGDTRNRALTKIIPALAVADSLNTLARLNDLKPAPSEEIYTRLFQRSAATDPVQAIQQWQQLPNHVQHDQSLCAIMTAWVDQQPDAALKWVNDQPDSPSKSQALATCIGELAKTDATRALTLAESLPVGDWRSSLVAGVFNVWAARDLNAATTACLQLPDGPAKTSAWDSVLNQRMTKVPAADPDTAVNWVSTFVATNSQPEQVQSVIKAWAEAEPAAVAKWLADLPAGITNADLDTAFLEGTVAKYPEFAGQWATAATNEIQRQKYQVQVAQQWMKSDPAAALKWASGLNLTNEIVPLK